MLKLAAVVVASLAFATTCCGQMSRFQGTWEATDSSAPGPTRITIEGKKVHLIGKCDAKPCDLGEVKATPVFSLADKKVVALQGVKSTKLAITAIEIYPEGADDLRVSTRLSPTASGMQRSMSTTGVFRRVATSP